MKTTTAAIALIALGSIGGCSQIAKSGYGAAPIEIDPQKIRALAQFVDGADSDLYAEGDALRFAMTNYLIDAETCDNSPQKKDPDKSNPDEQKSDNKNVDCDASVVKREVIGLMLDQSEAICSAYLTSTFGFRNTISSSLDVSGLAFGAVGPLLSAGSTGPALSATSTFLTDTNKSYQRTFYGDSDLSVVGRKIRADREDARKVIDDILEKSDQELSKYSFGSLSAKVQQYHSMCGLNYGIESLKAAAETSVTEQENESEETKLTVSDEQLEILRGLIAALPASPK